MKRADKIKILEEIHAGRIPIDYLKPPKVYVFMQDTGDQDKYQMDGKTFSKKEVEEFERNIELKNRRLNPKDDRPKDTCIVVEFKKGYTIL